jgi:phage tail protein X
MAVYVSKQGDVLDKICLAHYGTTGNVEAVLKANPGLAARGAVLPAGVSILLPDKVTPPSLPRVTLWT